MRRVALLLGLLLAVASVAWAQDAKELELDQSVVSHFVTPHTAWAKPYALGPARVLFFLRGQGTNPREVIELEERFDLQPQMVFWARIVDSTREGWHGGDLGVRRMLRLLNQKWDAYVFLGIPLSKVPTEGQYKLLKAVTEGAGLVLCGTDDSRVLKTKNLIAPLPPFLAPGPVGEAFRIRAGRGIRLPAQPDIAYAPGWEAKYDYWQERLGRAILWAAGKQPQVNLTFTRVQPEVSRRNLPQAVANIDWQAPAAAANLKLAVTLRRADGQKTVLPTITATGREGSAAIQVPLVRADGYHLDVIARSNRGVEAFASAAFSVTSPRQVTQVKLDRDWAEPGGKLSGTVDLQGPVSGADEHLRVSLIDSHNRELVRQDLGPQADQASFSFPVEKWMPMLLRVQATLLQGNRELSSTYAFARVTNRHRGQFNFVIWDIPTGSLAPYGEESLARTGVTCNLSSGEPPLYAAANNISWVPYTTRILANKTPQGIMKPCCWDDEAKIQEYVNQIVAKRELDREHGVYVYSLGDEGVTHGSCLSPDDLAAYRKYLQSVYGDIKALNAEWGTDFGSFGEVTLSKPNDNDEAEALRAGDFPRWYDRQEYQSYNFCQLCKRFGAAFRAMDPRARCGFEGAGKFGTGDDIDLIVRSNTFWSPYPGTADEVLRSIAPPGFPHANWMGYTKDANTLLEKYWRMIVNNCDAVWWWRWDGIGRFHGWLSPTLDPFPAVQDILKDTRIVRDGLGDLLLRCQMQDDGVGMLYSQPSAYAAQVQDSTSYGSYEADHVAWQQALRDLDLNFRYVTDRMLRRGEFKPADFKVMILPMIQAIGPRGAEVLRNYVRNGGVLIADVRPGIYDGHVKPLASGMLDDVFGIKRTGAGKAATTDGAIKGQLGNQGVAVQLSDLRVDADVQPTTAQALGAAGKSPLMLVNNFGKGKAILLNFAMSSYPVLSADATPEADADCVKALVASAGVKPAVTILDANGKRLRNIQVTRWSDGSNQIISIFRHNGAAQPAQVLLSQPGHVYDLKGGADLGAVKSFKLQITPYRAEFYAVTPGGAPAPTLTMAQPTVSRGSLARVRLSLPAGSGDYACKLQVKHPDGTVAETMSQVLVLGRQGAEAVLPVAYNDPTGNWTVTATELFSHRPQTCHFTVR